MGGRARPTASVPRQVAANRHHASVNWLTLGLWYYGNGEVAHRSIFGRRPYSESERGIVHEVPPMIQREVTETISPVQLTAIEVVSMKYLHSLLATLLVTVSLCTCAAREIQIRITVENLAPENSVALAPFRFGFGNGTFNAFNNNEVAFDLGFGDISQAPIVTIAEGGSGSNWFPAFSMAEPNANLGSITGPVIGPFLPGQVNSGVFTVDTDNQFFTFGTMVVPSTDAFLGNANPMAFRVFDDDGNLILPSFTEDASRIWDAGSETQNPANGAFIVGGVNDNRVNENMPVTFNFTNLSAFDGVETPPGYFFDFDTLTATTPVIGVSFQVVRVVPEPSSIALIGTLLAGAGLMIRGCRGNIGK